MLLIHYESSEITAIRVHKTHDEWGLDPTHISACTHINVSAPTAHLQLAINVVNTLQ